MSTNVGNVGTYLYGGYDHTSVVKEDLASWIAMISPDDTPLLDTLSRTRATGVLHEWNLDTLAAVATRGVGEGLDWEAPTDSAPSRPNNQCEIFLQNVAVTETMRAVATTGFADAYAYQVQKKTKQMKRNIESALMNDGTPTTGTSATSGGRVMKSLEELITTNRFVSTNYSGTTTVGTTGNAGVLAEKDMNDMLQQIYLAGGSTNLIVANAPYKRQISNFSANSKNTRYINADEKKLVVPVNVYDSEFGAIPIQLNRWSPKSTNTATATAGTATAAGINDITGRIWLLEKEQVRTAWLRDIQHNLMGRRGDSVVGQVVAELTLEVGAEASCGVLTGVNNFVPSVSS